MEDLGVLKESSYAKNIPRRNIPEKEARERLSIFYEIWDNLTAQALKIAKKHGNAFF